VDFSRWFFASPAVSLYKLVVQEARRLKVTVKLLKKYGHPVGGVKSG
jgi:hypothetical protein